MAKKRQLNEKDTPAWQRGLEYAKQHHIFGSVMASVYFQKNENISLIEVRSDGYIYFNPQKKYGAFEWAALFQIAALHLFLGKTKSSKIINREYETAALLDVVRFWKDTGGAESNLPYFLKVNWVDYPYENLSQDALEEKFAVEGLPTHFETLNLANQKEGGALLAADKKTLSWQRAVDFEKAFAKAIRENLKKTFELMGREDVSATPELAEAKNWLLRYFPLAGVIVNSFKIIESVEECEKQKIRWGAVNGATKEIYVNPKVFDIVPGHQKKVQNYIWLLSHLALHVAFLHRSRGVGRDRWYWNLACDLVVNKWLQDLQVGVMPMKILAPTIEDNDGVVDNVYERLIKDIKLSRKWETLRGPLPDIMDDDDEIYGLMYDEDALLALLKRGYEMQVGRGDLPAGLEEEIKVLLQPPIAWETELAHWLGRYLPQRETVRSYAHPSRRQSATPDIPTAREYVPEEEKVSLTFGVIVDTSGSMMRLLLGKVLGIVAGYAQDKGVEQVRLVFCDAEAYDAGYVPVVNMLNYLRVQGRGGTILQRGVDLLENAKDFPKNAPILILTDGFIDELVLSRPHAYVLPKSARLPYKTSEEIFYVK